MRATERLELISLIGRELQSRYTFSEIYHYLAAHSVPKLVDGDTGSKWVYVKEALAGAQPQTIIQIAAELGIAESQVDQLELPENWKSQQGFRLFISHISKDKLKATRLRDALSVHGISAFVAHEDIVPTKPWEQELLRALFHMHALVSIHTPGFAQSNWTQQELGFALGRGTKVISFEMGELPTGFLAKQQALPRRRRTAEQIAEVIVELLKNDDRTAKFFGETDEFPF